MTEPTEENDMQEVSRLRWDCPYCGGYMKVRTSKTHLPVFRVLYLNCTNEFSCGYRCKVEANISETLVPSYLVNADVNIKLSPWLERKVRLESQGQMRLIDEPKKEPKK